MNKNFFTALILCVTIFCAAISSKNIFAEDISSVSENFSQPQITVDGKVVDLGDLCIFKYLLPTNEKLDSIDCAFFEQFGYEISQFEGKQMITISMVPLRVIANEMRYKVDWDRGTQEIFLENAEGSKMRISIGKDTYWVGKDGLMIKMELSGVTPFIYGNTTFVPTLLLGAINYSCKINGNHINFTKI